MSKEKFQIPMPNEQIIQIEINEIISAGLTKKESFLSYLKRLYKQIGMKNLLPVRWNEIFILLSVMTILLFLSNSLSETKRIQEQDLYAFIFFISPIVFMSLSIYHVAQKFQNATFEVERVCKYNIYQVTAFRMLVFSMISILINAITILFLVFRNDEVHFFRSFMISTTSLFLFSVIFLFFCMKRQSGIIAAAVISGWAGVNVICKLLDSQLYKGFLLNAPIFVYAIVLALSILLYLKYISKLVHFKSVGGV
jgi:hypothetical protein